MAFRTSAQGEKVAPFLTERTPGTFDTAAIREVGHGRIAHFHLPRHVIPAEEFPMTITSKVQNASSASKQSGGLTCAAPSSKRSHQRRCRHQDRQRGVSGTEAAAPSTAVDSSDGVAFDAAGRRPRSPGPPRDLTRGEVAARERFGGSSAGVSSDRLRAELSASRARRRLRRRGRAGRARRVRPAVAAVRVPDSRAHRDGRRASSGARRCRHRCEHLA